MNYRQSAKDIAAELGSDVDKGLSIERAHERIHSRGRNIVRIPKKINFFVGIRKHVFSLMNIMLLLMAMVHFLPDGGMTRYLSVFFVVCAAVNSAVGYISFRRDNSPAKAVSAAQNENIRVLRSGIEKVVPASLMALGDVFFLEAGQTVPADAKIIECSGVIVDESILSGDGGSVVKSSQHGIDDEGETVLYMGTRLISGSVKAIATAVGDNTQVGSSMGLVMANDERVSSLARKNGTIGNIFGTIAALVWLVAFLMRLIRGYGVDSAFENAIHAALAVMPFTLPVLVLITISLNVVMLKRKGVELRSSAAVDTLGAATLLCVGKRGTLTRQGFEVGGLRPGNGFDENQLRRLAAMCTTADISGDRPVGDPMQVALIDNALANGLTIADIRDNTPVEQVLDNHRESRLMVTIHRTDRGHLVICKGAPDAVAACCSRIYDEKERPFDTTTDLPSIISESNSMASEAMSVMAVAYKETVSDPRIGEIPPEKDLVFAGLIGLSNAVRKDTPAAVKQLRAMGVRTCLITNENLTTASAVAEQSGIPKEYVEQGANVDCSDLGRLRKTTVFADVGAKQKADIVAALNAEKENVVTVGRGMRDISAMNSSDVSVATDAGAKLCSAAADVRISGSGMGRIAEAVRECKRAFLNIERMIGFLLSCCIAQAVCAIIPLVMGYSTPFSSAGIIWLQLTVSAVAAIGIWCEPYHRSPAKKDDLNTMKSGRLSRVILRLSIFRGLLMGGAAMIVYYNSYGFFGVNLMRSMVVLILSISFAFMAQSCRSMELTAVRFLKNPISLFCLALNLIVCIVTVNSEYIRDILGIEKLNAGAVAICVLAGILPMLIAEAAKLIIPLFSGKKRGVRKVTRKG